MRVDRYGFFGRTSYLYSYVNLYEKINLGIKKKPDVVVLGTSRAFLSFNPEFANLNIFNAASHIMLPDHYIYMLESFLYQTEAKKFIIFLDFFSSNENLKRINNFKLYDFIYSDNFIQKYKNIFLLYYNFSNFIDSFKILAFNNGIYISQNGYLPVNSYEKIYTKMTVNDWYKKVENDYRRRIFNNAHFNFNSDSKYLQFLKKICDIKNNNNIEIIFAISPVHSKMLEIIDEKNYKKDYFEWKKNLSFQKKNCEIDVFDFTDPNINDEFFYEISHIKEAYMNKIQNVIFNRKNNINYKKNEQIIK
jgi:hypothetical protein